MSVHNQGQEEVTLARTLGLFDAIMIGVGAMIGAGVFVLTGIAAGEAGPAAIIAFALNGVVTLFTAFSYAELASAIPEASGRRDFHPASLAAGRRGSKGGRISAGSLDRTGGFLGRAHDALTFEPTPILDHEGGRLDITEDLTTGHDRDLFPGMDRSLDLA